MKSGVQPWMGCGSNAGWLAGRRAVGGALLRFAAADQLRVGRLAQDDLGLRPLLAQHAADAGQRAAGAIAGDEIVEPLALEVGQDLARRGRLVDLGVGFGLELVGQEPAIRLASSTAFWYMPKPFCARGVSTTLAPSMRISLRRSIEKLSAMVTTSG